MPGATTEYRKPLPNLEDPAWAPFWAAAKQRRLSMPRCQECRHVVWPVQPSCTECLSPRLAWEDLSGRGELFSWVHFHQGYHPEWAKETPYNVALVRLDEGIVFLTNLVDCDREALRLGMPLEVVFDEVTETVSIPKFRPAP